jgi:hypothetical protein
VARSWEVAVVRAAAHLHCPRALAARSGPAPPISSSPAAG